MPVGELVSIGWIVNPPASYRGAEVELLQVCGLDLWALRVHRDGGVEERFFSSAEALERHLRPDPLAPEPFVCSARPAPRDS